MMIPDVLDNPLGLSRQDETRTLEFQCVQVDLGILLEDEVLTSGAFCVETQNVLAGYSYYLFMTVVLVFRYFLFFLL